MVFDEGYSELKHNILTFSHRACVRYRTSRWRPNGNAHCEKYIDQLADHR